MVFVTHFWQNWHGCYVTTGLPTLFPFVGTSGTTVDSRAQERHVLRRMFSGRADAPKPQVKIHSGWVVCSLSSLSWIVGPVLPLQNSANYATLSGPCFASSSVSVQQSAVLWDLKSLPRPTNTKDATRAAWRNRLHPVSHPHQTKVEWFKYHGGPRKVSCSGTAFSLSRASSSACLASEHAACTSAWVVCAMDWCISWDSVTWSHSYTPGNPCSWWWLRWCITDGCPAHIDKTLVKSVARVVIVTSKRKSLWALCIALHNNVASMQHVQKSLPCCRRDITQLAKKALMFAQFCTCVDRSWQPMCSVVSKKRCRRIYDVAYRSIQYSQYLKSKETWFLLISSYFFPSGCQQIRSIGMPLGHHTPGSSLNIFLRPGWTKGFLCCHCWSIPP